MRGGRVWRFGDGIDTDAIIPGQYLDNQDPAFLAKHVMEGVDPTFSSKVAKGDVIVAGKRFGIGSSREQAVIALKAAGVDFVIAESFARIFYRNAVNLGVLPIVCPGCASMFESGDMIVINLEGGKVSNAKEQHKSLDIIPLSPTISEIYLAGGLVNLLRAEIERNKHR